MGERTDEVIIQETVTQREGLSDADRLHAEIEMTRMEIARTLDEIKFQLSPSHLRERAKATVKEASIGRARRIARNANMHLRSTIREHPLTSVIMGLSAFWLLKEGFHAARSTGNGETGAGYPYGAEMHEGGLEGVQSGISEKTEQLKSGLGSARERADRMKQQMRERAGEYGEKAKATAARYGERARTRASEFKDKASDYASRTREAAMEQKERMQDSFSRMKNERPLVLAAAAFAFGAIVGSLIPETRKEHELMGEPKEKVAERLKEKSQESFERAKTVARDVAEETKKRI
jgi:hypothetical protein